jgi:hypothetical protein
MNNEGAQEQESVRHYLRDEAKEMRPYSLEYVEDFFGSRTTQMGADHSPQ